MYKVMMNGSKDALATTNELQDGLAILFPALDDEKASGYIQNMETGEKVVIVESGHVTYIAPDTLIEMLDAIYKVDPAAGLSLALMGLAALS